jgi:hypothetical protein
VSLAGPSFFQQPALHLANHRFLSLVFSLHYKSLLLQLFSFHIDAKPRGVSIPCIPLNSVPAPAPTASGCLCGSHDFVRPLFSYSYELLFPQFIYFDNYPNCPGVWGIRLPSLALRSLCLPVRQAGLCGESSFPRYNRVLKLGGEDS